MKSKLNEYFKSFQSIFDDNCNATLNNELSLILEKVLFILNSYDFNDFEKIFAQKQQNEAKDTILILFKFILSNYSLINNAYTLYNTITFINRYENYVQNVYNQNILLKICERIIEITKDYYKGIPFYNWHFIDRNILDEMNALKVKLNATQTNQ